MMPSVYNRDGGEEAIDRTERDSGIVTRSFLSTTIITE